MSEQRENCNRNAVDIARNTTGTPTAKLIAILEAHGITSAADLAEIVGISDRAIRKSRNHSSGTTVPAGTTGPELQDRSGTQVPKTELQDRNSGSNPSCAHATKESPTEISFTNVVKLASSREDLSETMITDIVGWMHGGDRLSAQNWLASTVKTFGQEATASGYHKLKTDLATGSVISRKLQAWSEIARRYKAKPEAHPQANYRSTPALDQTASIFEKIRAEAANAAG